MDAISKYETASLSINRWVTSSSWVIYNSLLCNSFLLEADDGFNRHSRLSIKLLFSIWLVILIGKRPPKTSAKKPILLAKSLIELCFYKKILITKLYSFLYLGVRVLNCHYCNEKKKKSFWLFFPKYWFKCTFFDASHKLFVQGLEWHRDSRAHLHIQKI